MTLPTGLRQSNGAIACPPFTNGPYTWDQNLVLSGTVTMSGVATFSGGLQISSAPAAVASTLGLGYATTTAASETATMTNAVTAGNPTLWLDVYYGTTKYLVPLFPSA